MPVRFMLLLLACLSWPLRAQTNAEEQSAVSNDSELCSKLFAKTVVAYQDLHRKLPPNAIVPANSPLAPLLGLHAEDCGQPGTMELIEKALTTHNGKVALLLPFSKMPKSAGQDVLRSVHEWMQSKGLVPGRLIIWRDTEGNREKLERQLAHVIWVQGASIVIGGLFQNEAPFLTQWADRLRVPAIILNRRPEGPASKYTFYMGPDYRLLASGLTRYALGRNIKRVAIMAPQFSHDEALIAAFRAQAQHLRIQVTGPLIYNPADYSSIDGLLRKLFHIDDESRNEELLELVNKGKEAAEQLGVPFDAKSIVLPPVIDVDAILIADHFKNVRHLSKSMAFYGVKRLPLLGIPKWRAFELIEPADENLVGSVFVDYLGSYKQLPYGIQVPTVDKEYFAEGPAAGSVDLRLVVHHALFSALQALGGPRSPRYALYKKLETSAGPRESFLSGPQIFRADHSANWPTFLFGVGSGSISVLQVWNPLTGPTRTSSSRP
ncbi:MAG TPA: ABC transporter substrate-binding protein [Oligoflexus sp.]|uniref:ABC transporter substrate-binding protein n=1 Tax=Oligoflexus sp. TaxID=1971216 RepID=UPI002D643DAA|nr:ABC transporter substrate-binding protein [Oligoflexus sp.]HYX33016.1 ABC transporter substrate-binding protein [Oligoflexus sp.]